jgi:HEAT repeat protein
MKKILYMLILLCTISTVSIAQHADQRTVTTRIADVLMKFPSQDEKQFNANMEEIGSLGQAGYQQLIAMLLPTGKGDNSKLQYAISGFSYYATKPGKAALKSMSINAYIAALAKLNDVESKRFIITQFQTVGSDAAVNTLASYLNDETLCDPAAQALVKINTTNAKQALAKALEGAQGNRQVSIITALGDIRATESLSAITALAGKGDQKVQKVVFYALSRIADPSSEGILAQAAEKAGYTYENTNANGAYIDFAKQLIADGKKDVAEKAVINLIKKGKGESRLTALSLLVEIQGEKSEPYLLAGALDKNGEYRASALKLARPYVTASTLPKWLKQLKKSKGQQQAEIIKMLGDYNAEAALPVVLKSLNSKDADVKASAIEATGKLGGDQYLGELFKILEKGNAEDIAAVEKAMMIMKGNNITSKAAAALPALPASGQVALINVLSARAAHDQISVILPLLNHNDAAVKQAAYAALKNVSAEDNLPELFNLLNTNTVTSETAEIQKAITSAIASSPDKAKQASLLVEQLGKVPADKKGAYFNILAGIGGKNALDAVSNAFKSGDSNTQKAALTALSQWSDASAGDVLYRVSKEANDASLKATALNGYIQSITKGNNTAEQKILLLRNAMEIAKSGEQKKAIMKEVEKNKTISGLFFAAKYLDDAEVQQEAATAVMNIALADKNYFGTNIRQMLEKTIQVLKGQDSDYQKQSIRKYLSEMPQGEGFVSIFNGKDLTGWKGLVENPIKRAQMDAKTLAAAQEKADAMAKDSWKVINGELVFQSHGDNLATIKKYGDFEMLVDWKIIDDGKQNGDAGIYLRGTPQVQIWDTTRVNDGAQVGSGGLYNNQVNESKPLKVADNPLDEWNHFRIKMIGDRVTVHLNGELVTDNVVLENFWDRALPIFAEEQIELQAHGSPVAYRDIYIREIPRPKPFELSAAEKKEGYKVLFDGTNMHEWTGNLKDYVIDDGTIYLNPAGSHGGNLFTKKEYSNFVFRFEFQLTPGANNGLGIRAPLEGDAAYTGIELQILDNEAEIYKDLAPYQYHGSAYGILAAKRGFLKPVGEWNYQEVTVNGPKIKVVLNGTVILDGDITDARKNGTLDKLDHPGLKRDSGHIGFLGHGSEVRFKNIRIKELKK